MDASNAGSAKRSRSESRSEFAESNGQNKRRSQNGSNLLADEVVYRVLCPSSKIGSVIGKGGSVIKSLRDETGAKIRVEDGLPGADERVIIVANSGKDRDRGSKKIYNDEEHDNTEERDEAIKASGEGFLLPSVQEALFKIHAKIFDVENLSAEGEEEASPTVTTRLLVPHNQIGCLLGKGGKVIEQMRSETAAQIRIFSKEKLPSCAFPDDELVQISGDWRVVKQALHAVGSLLYENPSRDRLNRGNLLSKMSSGGVHTAGPFFSQNNSGLTGSFVALPLASLGSGTTGAAGHWPYGSSELNVIPSLSGSHENQNDFSEEEFVIRILCPDDKIGSVIGRGGNLIRQMREETRAKIKIEDPVSESDERVITISSVEVATSTISPTLQATLQLQSRIADLTMDKDTTSSNTRLLVPKKDIGCLLGKGGNVITEMRRSTRANIRVMPKSSLPRCALDSDELVQITDFPNVARVALIEIVSRLRDNLFKEYLRSIGVEEGTNRLLSLRQGTNIDRLYESRTSEDSYHISGLGGQTAVNSSYESYGTSTGTWAYQGFGGSSGLGGLSTYGIGGAKPTGLYGSSPAVLSSVASKTLEITIPSSAFSAVVGQRGSNIDHIRKVSDAKIKLHDIKSGSSERIIEISGTPGQTRLAQSLLEAFVDARASL